MESQSQRKANLKYRKKSVKQIGVTFYPKEQDQRLYNYIKSHDNINAYIKSLVQADMESNLL